MQSRQIGITLGTRPDRELLKRLRRLYQSELTLDQILRSSVNLTAVLFPTRNVGYPSWHLKEALHSPTDPAMLLRHQDGHRPDKQAR